MEHTPAFRIADVDAHPPLCPMPIDHIGRMDADLFFSRLQLAGIDAACGALTPPPDFFETHTPEDAVSLLNRGAAALASANPRYLPALHVHPDCPDFSIAQLEEYASCGVRLLDAEARHLPHPSMASILRRAQTLGMTVCLHKETIAQSAELAACFPDLRILMGGSGSTGYMPKSAFALMQAHPNLCINLSGVIWTINYALHEWIERFGADRVFFGSGYPFCNPAGRLAAARWELRDQPDAVRESVLCKNALNLLGVKGGIS